MGFSGKHSIVVYCCFLLTAVASLPFICPFLMHLLQPACLTCSLHLLIAALCGASSADHALVNCSHPLLSSFPFALSPFVMPVRIRTFVLWDHVRVGLSSMCGLARCVWQWLHCTGADGRLRYRGSGSDGKWGYKLQETACIPIPACKRRSFIHSGRACQKKGASIPHLTVPHTTAHGPVQN